MPLIVYGIKNCDTMKKAFAWLDAAGIAYAFHDYKKSGVTLAQLQRWAKQIDAAQPTKPSTNTPADTPAQGWQALANRRGPTWRKVAEAATPAELGQARTLALLCDNTSAIRRPILERDGKDLLLGFDAPAWAKTLGK